MEARPEGRRTRGRPIKNYIDGIEERARNKGTEVIEMKRLQGINT